MKNKLRGIIFSGLVTSGMLLPISSFAALGFFSSGLQIGITGLYLKPYPTKNDLQISQTPPVNITLKPTYSWDYALDAQYIFPHNGYDFGVNYLHIANTTSKNLAVNETIQDVNVPINTNIAFKAKYKLNQIDATLGRYMEPEGSLLLHPFAGLRWLKLDRNLDGNETFMTPAGVSLAFSGSGSRTQYSHYQGIGPIIGVDGIYPIVGGLGVYGKLDGAVLWGRREAKENNFVQIDGAQGQLSIDKKLKNTYVPVFDAKLALNYLQPLSTQTNTNIIVRAGWQYSNYFSAISKVSIDSPDAKKSNIAFSGPFAELAVQF